MNSGKLSTHLARVGHDGQFLAMMAQSWSKRIIRCVDGRD
jgi:hypothetical protein